MPLNCVKLLILYLLLMVSQLGGQAQALPLETDLLNAQAQPIAKVLIYIDYIEVTDLGGTLLGKVGIVNVQGEFRLFLVKEDKSHELVGWAANKKLYDAKDTLKGYYDWSTFWVYAYNDQGKKVGKAKCIAFRGICAAGTAAYLLGLF